MKNRFNFLVLVIICWFMTAGSFAQVGIGTNAPNSSAILELQSTDKGFLPPVMAEVQRNAIENPASGLMIWCSDCGNTGQMQVFNGTAWTDICGGTAAAFICGVSKASFTYNGQTVSYGTVVGAGNKCWLDRNLGATQVATSSTDEASYGHLFQWGRLDDGHQLRTSSTTTALSNSDVPGHNMFIMAYDWRSPQNDNLWQGGAGTNNPCPVGYRLPIEAEWNLERLSWAPSNNASGAFASPLKLTKAGFRSRSDGSFAEVGSYGVYWSSTVSSSASRRLYFDISNADIATDSRGYGFSVRCLKDDSPAGIIGSLDCTGATITGTLTEGIAASGVSAEVLYTLGNGGPHSGQTVNSTGVIGLTATTPAGSFAYADGALIYTISGTPLGSGTATFALNIGGKNCNLIVTVACNPGFITEVVEVTSAGGKIWMDRNLGAHRAATSSTDGAAYGYLYQWGRLSDGHQCRTSGTMGTLSGEDIPGHGNFITVQNSPYDWRSPQNDNLWQGEAGTNNPCPDGYRLPTLAEWNTEELSWSPNNAAGAFNSPLKMPVAGRRYYFDGSVYDEGSYGRYWSSTVNGVYVRNLFFSSSDAYMGNLYRASGMSVRCIKD